MLSDSFCHFSDILQISSMIGICGCTDSAHDDVCELYSTSSITREPQSTFAMIADNQFCQTEFIDGYDAILQILYLLCIDVYTHHFMANLSETRSRHESDISCSKYCYLHSICLLFIVHVFFRHLELLFDEEPILCDEIGYDSEGEEADTDRDQTP